MMITQESQGPLWQGRTSIPTSEIFSKFVDSISFDIELGPYDLAVSRAHAKMLQHVNIIEEETLLAILDGLNQIEQEMTSGVFKESLIASDEDIHTAIERRLTEIAGDWGRALHTGRSRNDLAQMSARLYIRDSLVELVALLKQIIGTLTELADKNIEIMFPGKTHLQHAQPVLLSHWLLSHAYRFINDLERVKDLLPRVNVCVLGSGAIAGSTLPLDSQFVADELKCSSIVDNSIFGVSTRDYLSETLFVVAQIMVNLSCLGEDIVWMSSTECSYVALGDDFTSGSSMMPQKKNPDIAELVRGKAGLSIGALTAMLSASKSQIFGYNHDLQVDKEALFPSIKDCKIALVAMSAMMTSATFNENNCHNALISEPLLLATDIAEEMVNNGIAFRIAYKQVATAIRTSLDQGLAGEALVEKLKGDPQIGVAATKIFGSNYDNILKSMRESINRRNTSGATSTQSVVQQINNLRELINK